MTNFLANRTTHDSNVQGKDAAGKSQTMAYNIVLLSFYSHRRCLGVFSVLSIFISISSTLYLYNVNNNCRRLFCFYVGTYMTLEFTRSFCFFNKCSYFWNFKIVVKFKVKHQKIPKIIF